MKVKICGIKKPEDALFCAQAGADALGFLVGQKHTSPDFVSKTEAKMMISILNEAGFKYCDTTLVTHLLDEQEIIAVAKYINCRAIQLHSSITDRQVKKIRAMLPGIKLTRLVHISAQGEIAANLDDIQIADAYLLDSFNLQAGQVGGTGKTHNWDVSAQLVKILKKPVILAGGLNPGNVAEAVQSVQPFGVDVNSGVKNQEGFKDYEKIKQFIQNAKQK